ncbi:unnamed protein product [Dovyalis caffra]|uniref:TIR domain-containing protein n=1 Tax=Dovyalis caffra TaxID=77055 RepID=A0AAV1QRL3_9ROSI|nr:unnamed protein product [Dovyalis caffra]
MARSSSTSTTKLRSKHHVFLSFRGEDTRVGFTSHLHAALERKNILTFIDDDLKRGEEISDSLVKAIEDSMLSVIIFSPQYASSKWCLDELVKILECRKIRGQIAIPVFYQVDPSDVRKRSGCFGDAFAELVKRKALEIEEERCFRAALNEAANISGHDSRKIESESKFIEEIVRDVFNRLCKMFPIHPTNLVGIDERIRKIESLLEMESQDGTKAIKGICLDMSTSREMQLKSDAFAWMRCLEFLIIKGNKAKVQLPHCGLEYLSNMLRYFRWDGYPSRSLPQKFCAENLVELDFSWSKVEELWSGQQNFENLRRINLSYSPCLTKVPGLSKAEQLQYVDLQFCGSLTEVPSSFEYFEHLESLIRHGCYNLQCFPRRLDSNNIKSLSLTNCSNIKKSPEISANINSLYLDGTSIEEVPSSIEFLANLQRLNMNNCKKLSRLPSSICKLKSLEYLYISGCSKLESFPEIMEPMESLKGLSLKETAIRELPSSIRHLKSLLFLYLDGTLIKELSELPPSLQYLTANNCESLEIISSSTLGNSAGSQLSFANCFKIDQKALMADMQSKIEFGKALNHFEMVLPGSKIPELFSDQRPFGIKREYTVKRCGVRLVFDENPDSPGISVEDE